MHEFFDIALSLPTLVYSVLLGTVVLYWLMVVVGAFDIDLLDSVLGLEGADAAGEGLLDGVGEGAAEGLFEGAGEGAAEGLLEGGGEGASEGLLEGGGESMGEGLGDGAAEGVGGSSLAGSILSILSLRGVPMTVSVSLLTVYGWLATFIATFYLAEGVTGGLRAATLAAIPVVALALAFPLTVLSVRPLRGIFGKGAARRGQQTLVGTVCTVSTLSVDERFGQGLVDDKAAGLTLSIRCDSPNELTKGSKALIISCDAATNVYSVEPYDALMSPSPRPRPVSVSATPNPKSAEVGAKTRT